MNVDLTCARLSAKARSDFFPVHRPTRFEASWKHEKKPLPIYWHVASSKWIYILKYIYSFCMFFQ